MSRFSGERPKIPLCVDLDGTLIKEDVTRLGIELFTLHKPWRWLLLMAWWARGGRPFVKQQLGTRIFLPLESLTPNPAFLKYLHTQYNQGRLLVLATGAHYKIAEGIAQNFGIFHQVIATKGEYNCVGTNKAALLIQNFGAQGFDYAGNSPQDLAVWRHCRQVIAVNCPAPILQQIRQEIPTPMLTFDLSTDPLGDRHER